jgi:ribokinase
MSAADAQPPRLVCCGNLTLDDIVLPDGTVEEMSVGGDALYGVLAARLLLPDAEMLAPVGCDLPQHVWDMIDAAGLSRHGLPARGWPTIRTRFVYQTADRRIVTLQSSEADFDRLSPRGNDIPARFWGADAFMVLAMTLAAQRDLVRDIRAKTRALIALDTQEEYCDGNEAAILDLASQVDVFMPSADEVRRLIGAREPAEAARYFASLGPRVVVIKLGAAGCLVHDAISGEIFMSSSVPGPVVDTTGAGDAFCSAFVASMVTAPRDLRRAASSGGRAASLAIGGFGVRSLFEAGRAGVPVPF